MSRAIAFGEHYLSRCAGEVATCSVAGEGVAHNLEIPTRRARRTPPSPPAGVGGEGNYFPRGIGCYRLDT